MDREELKYLIFAISIVLLILGGSIVLLFMFFQRKKANYLSNQEKAKKKYDDEISRSKIEIREKTLENISWEIHDNIGQLLSVTKMQLNILHLSLDKEQQAQLEEASELLSKSLQELRSLAKSLNPEHFKTLGLLNAIKLELNRYNRMRFIDAKLEVSGIPYELTNDKGLILFRILQEFFNNTLKHAKGTKLCVMFNYKPQNLEIKVVDNGVGFDLNTPEKRNGLGLKTMKSRAALIGASLKLESQKNKGTSLLINYSNS